MTLFSYGTQLARVGKYTKAINTLEKMQVTGLPEFLLNFLCLILGRLYYLTKQEKKGNEYFDLLIKNARSFNVGRLESAKHIFTLKPYSQKGIDLLKEITEDSPSYTQALKMLSSNLAPKEYFEMFNQPTEAEPIDNPLQDTEMLNRSMYHKIKNEVSLLTEIVHEMIADTQDEMLAEIRTRIKKIFEGIQTRRQLEESKVKQIPTDNYETIITIISETAHDIVDFVNNELAIIQEDVLFALSELTANDPRRHGLNDLQKQLNVTQAALNDLKSVNAGIKIKSNHLQVKELFATWRDNPKLSNATISVDMQNPELELYLDKQKVKSILSELVENSLKYNANQADLQINMTAKEVSSIGTGQRSKMPGHKKYLMLGYRDNGKGISKKRKEWAFLPLKTSSKTSSGLGLFMIKRTLKEMDGYIVEKGKQGVHFEIRIPYGEIV